MDEDTELQDEKFVPTCNAGVESSDSDTDSSKSEQDSADAIEPIPSGSDNFSSQNTGGQ